MIALAIVAALLSWAALWFGTEPDNQVAPAAPSQSPVVRAPTQLPAAPPPAPPSPTPGEPLAEAQNTGERIAALRELRDRGAVEALPRLLELDPDADPALTPTLIGTIGRLARDAEPAQRTAAVVRLGAWLAAQSEREGEAARGNVAVIVDTLAQLRAPEAGDVLSTALDGGKLPVHVATVAVQGLMHLGAPSARAAVLRFRQRLEAAPASTRFERELHDEALRAVDQALSRLRRS